MPSHNFKDISKVPSSKELIDYVLSKTQRKTPTVIHKSSKIASQRLFYTKKVKTINQNIHDKIDRILKEFPVLKNLHKFYADWIHVLFNEDNLKSSFSNLSRIQSKCDKICQNAVKIIKYSDSQFACKSVKRESFGKMVTLLKNKSTSASLEYLEEVRQNLNRLPCIDTDGRTVLMCGYPNVGKSSFLNKISRADVPVESYAFTTKSLYIGHTDYDYLRWQFIDSPGLLDSSVIDMTAIERVTISALNFLDDVGLLFLMDISEICGYSIEKQVNLLKSIRQIYRTKPMIVGLNKIDVKSLDSLSDENKQLIESVREFDSEIIMEPISTLTGEGVFNLRDKICSSVLQLRNQKKITKLSQETLNTRLVHNIDVKPVENKVPQVILERIRLKNLGQLPTTKTRKELVNENPKYRANLRDQWILENPDDRYDNIPLLWEGHNILNFGEIDMNKVEAMEKELECDELELQEKDKSLYVNSLAMRKLAPKIEEAEKLRVLDNISKNNMTGRRTVERNNRKIDVSNVVDGMEKMGVTIDPEAVGLNKAIAKTRSRSESRKPVEMSELRRESISRTDPSRGRSRSGVRDEKTVIKLEKGRRDSQKKMNKKLNKQGDSDRRICVKMPKHLYSGKRGMGKTDRR